MKLIAFRSLMIHHCQKYNLKRVNFSMIDSLSVIRAIGRRRNLVLRNAIVRISVPPSAG